MTIVIVPPYPQRNDPNFATVADSWNSQLPTWTDQVNATAVTVASNATTATTQAGIATTQAGIAANQVSLATTQANNAANSAASAAATANVTKWISGTSYTEGQNVWSPIDFKTYRRKITGAGTTDPSLDAVNWLSLIIDTQYTLISTSTITDPVATIEFTGLSSQYFKYIIEIDNAQASTSPDAQNIQLQVYNSGAWITDSSYYYNIISGGTAFQNNYLTIVSSGAKFFSGTVSIINPAQSKLSHFITNNTISYYDSAGSIVSGGGNYYDRGLLVKTPSTSTVTGLRILGSTGNILAGTFKLYGVKA